jgi:hypothetical protein
LSELTTYRLERYYLPTQRWPTVRCAILDLFVLPSGNVAGVAIPLLDAAVRSKRLLADKAYYADSLRKWLK